MVSVNGSLGYWYRDTIHYSSHHCKDYGISYEKILKCLRMMEDVGIGFLMPSTLPLSIADVVMVVIMVEVYLGHKIPDTLSLVIMEFVILLLMVEVELGLKRPANFPLKIVEQELMLKG